MGYTHYVYTNLTAKDSLSFDRLIDVTKTIFDRAEQNCIQLADVNGDLKNGQKACKQTGVISFNGLGEDAHEAFELDFNYLAGQKDSFAFCKTARKEYDVVVVAVLVAAVEIFNFDESKFRVGSDGDYADWQEGIDMYCRAQGLSFKRRVKLNKYFRSLLDGE